MSTTESFHGTRVFKSDNQPRPIQVEDYSTIGALVVAPAADEDKFPLDEPVTIMSGDTAAIAALGTGGNVDAVIDAINDQADERFTSAEITIVRVAEGAGATEADKLEATFVKLVGAGAQGTGCHAFKAASRRPALIIAPGYTSQRIGSAKNPLLAELEGISGRLRSIVIADAPAGSKEAAVEFREDHTDNKRLYIVSPGVMVAGSGGTPVFQPASGRVSGLFVRRDKSVGGPHWSPSNQMIQGIVGVSRPVPYYDGEPDCEANFLNQQQIATIIEGGRLWGNETCAADPLDRFVSVVRTEDMIDRAVLKGFRWANDQPINVPRTSVLIQSLQDFLTQAALDGVIIDGRVDFKRELNQNSSLVSGILKISYDREPYAPLNDLQFFASRNVAYYDQVADGITRTVQQISDRTRVLTYDFLAAA